MRITLFEFAMGPMLGGSIVATCYGQNPAVVSLMVGIRTLLALAMVPAWWAALAML